MTKRQKRELESQLGRAKQNVSVLFGHQAVNPQYAGYVSDALNSIQNALNELGRIKTSD